VQPHAQFGFDDLRRILIERVGIADDHIGNDPSEAFDDIGLDSLAFIELRTALEEEYGIEVRDEDVEHIYTLGDAIDYVNGRLAAQEPAQ
jgi:acyl carrier protein